MRFKRKSFLKWDKYNKSMNKFSLTFFNRLYTSYRNTVLIKENFFLKKKLDFEKSLW